MHMITTDYVTPRISREMWMKPDSTMVASQRIVNHDYSPA